MFNTVAKTPCIGICSTIYGDEVCRGCKRHFKEIIDWNGYNSEQKLQILARLEEQILTIISNYFQMHSENDFRKKLSELKIEYRPDYKIQCAIFPLLDYLGEQTKKINWIEYGLVFKGPKDQDPKKLFETMDDALYELALTETSDV